MRPGIRDPETWGPGPWHPETWDPATTTLGLGTCNPGTWDPVTRDPGNGTLGPCDWQLTPTTDCINFISEANFDNKKLGHVHRSEGARIQK